MRWDEWSVVKKIPKSFDLSVSGYKLGTPQRLNRFWTESWPSLLPIQEMIEYYKAGWGLAIRWKSKARNAILSAENISGMI